MFDLFMKNPLSFSTCFFPSFHSKVSSEAINPLFNQTFD
ncbi:hypothetical protein B4102_3858 [Heyndrickxia sporothermodurans]|uniref:Uncharacterized protein n=1 Tax=Heyndrickxia sporothermodurans TaxID=46224 RepID=A0A150KLK1_9BACI|nr:hypothetical protein B4102_3858 [Heyndrickxia sporothermodurans]